MIICSKCTKENQDHYKFCLGCGAELPRDGGAAKAAGGARNTPGQGVKAQSVAPQVGLGGGGGAPAPVAPVVPEPVAAPPAPVAAGPAPCPQCGHLNTGGNLFCAACGFRLTPAAAAPAAAAAAPAVAPAAGAAVAKPAVLTALRADGTEAGTYTLASAELVVGRETGGIFAADSYLSPAHARFKQGNGKLTVKDEGSLNGVYKKLARDVPVEIKAMDVFRIGQEIMKFEALEVPAKSADGVERLGSPAKGYIGRIALVVGRETSGNAFPVPESGLHMGRERGDVLFPEDGYVSGLHCRIHQEGGKLFLTDLGSSNGTFLRIGGEVEVKTGDVLLMGQQLFRVAL